MMLCMSPLCIYLPESFRETKPPVGVVFIKVRIMLTQLLVAHLLAYTWPHRSVSIDMSQDPSIRSILCILGITSNISARMYWAISIAALIDICWMRIGHPNRPGQD